MNCPECGKPCICESINVGVGYIRSPWECEYCGWTEDDAFPMTDADWERWLSEGALADDEIEWILHGGPVPGIHY